ncbi:hypothetical protein CORC01_00280 [Colletotrichum orchidophilum]|uniref:Uncharacterized protein n=1 Tax=Colletotrichum orchidophilum TaxID=1209926 RepID=A0A1G4BSR8_9PEZI|nr:uncharacterized protein CORC01_00280 [Colletotrichum orchidophilum]OHF04428.1 hypothetical protein CORC01_00280 [Colletotrichum orchidophilum]
MGICGFAVTNFFPAEFRNFIQGGSTERRIAGSDLESLKGPTHVDTGGSRRLRLFMPADGPNINLCKTIMSAVALGYPMPTLLNWNGEFNRPDWHFSGSHIAKLESLLTVIGALYEKDDGDDVNENDLVLLVDAYDIWFQLPPSVLIERFHQLNLKANGRVQKQWEESGLKPGFPISPPTQSIVVTTAKDCQPDRESGSDPRYDYWPDSPLPQDFYGEQTDQVLPYVFDSARKYKKIRPRCVNSGMIMGTIGSLRGALRKSKEKIDKAAASGRQLWSDQALFAEVIGDQEVWRHWVRGLSSTWNGFVSHENLGSLPKEVRQIADAALAGEMFEFGIGLDYEFATIPPTCSAEDDGYFVELDDVEAIRKESEKAGVPGNVRIKGTPQELKDVPRFLPGYSWGNISLYTDFFFGTAPVGIHHNAYIFGLKKWRLENWWSLTWFYPHLRDLVMEALDANRKLTPLARLLIHGDSGNEMVYWASEEVVNGKKNVRVFDGSKNPGSFSSIGWNGLCQKGDEKWYDVLFGDGKGPMAV